MSPVSVDIDKEDARSLNALVREIREITRTEQVLLIRNGRAAFDRSGWREFLSERCGLVLDRRQFNYKERIELVDWWEISYQPDKATAYAYSNTRQPLHCDNAWFSDPAELNFFIMERQARQGGEQTFYRMSRLLEDLERDEPGLLRDLTSVKVTVRKGDEEYYNHTEIIKLAPEPRIFWNYYRTQKDAPDVRRMCEAFFKFLEAKEATSSVERMRAATGDCFCWHDQRMLHGRTAFGASAPRDRIVFQSMWRSSDAREQ